MMKNYLELVEMEVRELLSFYEYDGDNTPIILVLHLGALNGEGEWVTKVNELMAAVDWIGFLNLLEIMKTFLNAS